jgi:hypothetical protein
MLKPCSASIKVFFILMLLISLSLKEALAEDVLAKSLCKPLEASDATARKVIIWQQSFDGVFDLAMAPATQSGLHPVIRLSFGGSKEATCHFPAIAVLKGGDWGWHVAWGSEAKHSLMVARVDGDAWVSSLPKKLADQNPDRVEFSEKDGVLRLTYQLSSDETSIRHRMISNDEGHNWDAVDSNQ